VLGGVLFPYLFPYFGAYSYLDWPTTATPVESNSRFNVGPPACWALHRELNSRGSKPHSPLFDNSQPSLQMCQPLISLSEGLQRLHYLRCRGVFTKPEHNNSIVQRWRIVADIRKIEITGDQYKVIAFRVCGDGIVRRIAHPNIADIFRVMP
jgi:hypothetical protein